MLKGYKTYVLAGVTTIGAIAGYLVDDLTLVQALNLIIPALTGAFVRNGITTALGKK